MRASIWRSQRPTAASRRVPGLGGTSKNTPPAADPAPRCRHPPQHPLPNSPSSCHRAAVFAVEGEVELLFLRDVEAKHHVDRIERAAEVNEVLDIGGVIFQSGKQSLDAIA